MCKNSIDFQRGNAHPDLVLLGACPGQNEWRAIPQRPFAGQSGVNLLSLLEVFRNQPDEVLCGLQPDDFISTNLDDYTLMNSHPEAKWPAEHGRSTPRMSEIGTQENQLRLTNQLRSVGARFVVGLGRPINDTHLVLRRKDSGPLRAIRLLAPHHPEISFYVTGHPSPRAVNRFGNGNSRQWFEETLWKFPKQ